MGNWKHVAKREYIERVRSKWFVIVTLLGPLGLLGVFLIPALVQVQSAKRTVKIGLQDNSGHYQQLLDVETLKLPKMMDLRFVDVKEKPAPAIESAMASGELNGFLVIPADILESGSAEYSGTNASDLKLRAAMMQLMHSIAMQARAKKFGISDAQFVQIIAPPIDVSMRPVGRDGKVKEAQSGAEVLILSYVWMFILYISIIVYGVNVMRSVIEEKTSRVIEMLVSCASPAQILMGKVIGVGLAGLTQICLWLLFGGLLLANQETVLGWFGVSAGGFSVPVMAATDIAMILGFFVLGYFFYAALYAAVGAAVTTEQEAQQAQLPVMILLIIPVLCAQLITDDPRGEWAQLLSQLPISSPTLMPMRVILDGAGPMEVLWSFVILVASLGIVLFGATRIYRAGLMRYGKRASLKEVLGWLKPRR